MNTFLSPNSRGCFAQAATALLAMPELFAAVEAEVETTLQEHPQLPRTEKTRCVLWGLALPKFSEAASAASPEPQSKTA